MSIIRFRPIVLAASVLLFSACASQMKAPIFCGFAVGRSRSEITAAQLNCAARYFPVYEDGFSAVPETPSAQMAIPVSVPQWYPEQGPVRIGSDVWQVTTYGVSAVGQIAADHYEYCVFKNDQIVAWGLGKPPARVRIHPDRATPP